MQDLVGIRIILLFKRDTELIADLIRKSFKMVKEYNSVDKLADNEFGYSSIHQIIELSDGWIKVPTLKEFGNIKAEIQIRTLAQHSWAEASTNFQYKNEENVPKPLKRTISRISALLETVDLEFERILQERTNYKDEIKEIQLTKKSVQKLDVELLKQILNDKLPGKNKTNFENYSSLLDSLSLQNIENSGELISLIEKYLSKTVNDDQEIAKEIIDNYKKRRPESTSHGYTALSDEDRNRAKSGKFLTHTGFIRHMLNLQTIEHNKR